MSNFLILHNPRCSKSRQTLALLHERDIQPDIIDYLNQPPEVEFLEDMLKKLDLEPTAIIRSKEQLFKDLGLSLKDKRSRTEWLNLLHANPKLIERPIVIAGERAVVGRPPENVLSLL